MKEKQFAVVGLGRFGMSLLTELRRMGHDVLAIDINEDKVNAAVDIATYAVQADAMDEQALKALGIRNFDVVIVSIGQNIQSNTLATIIIKEMGVQKVVAKAQTHCMAKYWKR